MSSISQTPTSVVIQLENISVFHGKELVLPNISFKLLVGEFIYLTGKVGSGKTSIIKTLTAELPLMTGIGYCCGYYLHKIRETDIPYLRRRIGVVFQDFQLLTDRTIMDNLLFVLEATGWKGRNVRTERANHVLEQVGMQYSGHKKPHQLSGGEQQRVVIARALLNNPSLILADEPTGNLDPDTSEGILELLHNIQQKGCAVLMATHNYAILNKYPQRVLRCTSNGVQEFAKHELVIE